MNIVLFLVAQSSKILPYLHRGRALGPSAHEQDATAAGIAPLEAARRAFQRMNRTGRLLASLRSRLTSASAAAASLVPTDHAPADAAAAAQAGIALRAAQERRVPRLR